MKPYFSRPIPLLLVLLACTTASCRSRLVGDIEEPEANRIIALLEDGGIAASKEKEAKGRNVSWTVMVSSEDLPAARRILEESGLPRAKRPGMSRLLDSSGLIPTSEEQKSRKAAALGEELSRTIETISGVVEARVLISLPGGSDFPGRGEEQRVESSASVLVKHRGKTNFTREDIRDLVSGAVAGMKPENVTIVLNEAGKNARFSKQEPYRKVGPFLVAPSSGNLLLGFIVALLGCNLVLAGIVVAGAFRFLRRRSETGKDSAGR